MVTFGASAAVGSPCSGVSGVQDGLVDSDGKESDGGQSVADGGTARDTGGAGMRSPRDGECSGSQGSDPSGENQSCAIPCPVSEDSKSNG